MIRRGACRNTKHLNRARFMPYSMFYLVYNQLFLKKGEKNDEKVLVVLKKALNLQQKTIKHINNKTNLRFMKKRILLSLVSFFMMTAMWAGLVEAYGIYVTAPANGVTNSNATLTLNMKNQHAIASGVCTIVLPEGVSFVDAAVSGSRYPASYNANFSATPNSDGSVTIACQGAAGVTLTGTDGEVATMTVAVASDAPVGEVKVYVNNAQLFEVNSSAVHNKSSEECPWIIEQGAEPAIEGDVNEDGSVDITDGVVVLDAIANGATDAMYDINGDGSVDISDFTAILDLMAAA